MVSQWSLKGTARPTHYHVLENGPDEAPYIPLDKIEQLLFVRAAPPRAPPHHRPPAPSRACRRVPSLRRVGQRYV